MTTEINVAAQAGEESMRAEFERQHKGRDLTRHRLRGTYSSAPIAALWNQHKRTAEWCVSERNKLQQAIDICAAGKAAGPAPVCCTQNCNQGRDCPHRQKGT